MNRGFIDLKNPDIERPALKYGETLFTFLLPSTYAIIPWHCEPSIYTHELTYICYTHTHPPCLIYSKCRVLQRGSFSLFCSPGRTDSRTVVHHIDSRSLLINFFSPLRVYLVLRCSPFSIHICLSFCVQAIGQNVPKFPRINSDRQRSAIYSNY